MSNSEDTNRLSTDPEAKHSAKKPYHKPAVRYERVFETRAISCGKVNATQSQCKFNQKS
jgi:hypothetical protein